MIKSARPERNAGDAVHLEDALTPFLQRFVRCGAGVHLHDDIAVLVRIHDGRAPRSGVSAPLHLAQRLRRRWRPDVAVVVVRIDGRPESARRRPTHPAWGRRRRRPCGMAPSMSCPIMAPRSCSLAWIAGCPSNSRRRSMPSKISAGSGVGGTPGAAGGSDGGALAAAGSSTGGGEEGGGGGDEYADGWAAGVGFLGMADSRSGSRHGHDENA